MTTITRTAVAALAAAGLTTAAQADSVGFADTIIDFFDSGAGPIAGPYGSDGGGSPNPVSTDVVLGNTPSTFLSLPTGTFVTVGFTDESAFDGPGDDIFISETGSGGEDADIFVSGDFGASFTFLGTAGPNGISSFDLSQIGFTDPVNAIKIVGLDAGGSSPGFDLQFVQILTESIGDPTDNFVVPSPTAAAMGLGMVGLLAARRRRSIG